MTKNSILPRSTTIASVPYVPLAVFDLTGLLTDAERAQWLTKSDSLRIATLVDPTGERFCSGLYGTDQDAAWDDLGVLLTHHNLLELDPRAEDLNDRLVSRVPAGMAETIIQRLAIGQDAGRERLFVSLSEGIDKVLRGDATGMQVRLLGDAQQMLAFNLNGHEDWQNLRQWLNPCVEAPDRRMQVITPMEPEAIYQMPWGQIDDEVITAAAMRGLHKIYDYSVGYYEWAEFHVWYDANRDLLLSIMDQGCSCNSFYDSCASLSDFNEHPYEQVGGVRGLMRNLADRLKEHSIDIPAEKISQMDAEVRTLRRR